MAGQGAGPSRRSHTKSRTGCKTCKRRHIRCDESYPQCRNCTKHQVRCDYMDNLPAEDEPLVPSDQATLPSNPEIERYIDLWLQTNTFPFPELQVFPPPQVNSHSHNDLHLIIHLSTIARSLLLNGTSDYNVWTSRISSSLSIASSFPYVMHAFLAFSASHLAWVSPESNARKLQIEHGGIALRGLHDSINTFSRANSDSILAASLLLMTQANDWRTYSSLLAGVLSVSAAMEDWKHESLFADTLEQLARLDSKESRPLPDVEERQSVLSGIISGLQRLQPFLTGHETESQWTNQLLGYMRTLYASPPAQTPVEQFDQLYRLRKWIHFVPGLLLERPTVEGPAILVLAHLYATALAIEPLFPSLGPVFCAAISIRPLEKIIEMTAPMQIEQHFGQTAHEISGLMRFPQTAAVNFQSRMAWASQTIPVRVAQLRTPPPTTYLGAFGADMETQAYPPFANPSPGLLPSSLHSSISSGSHSPFLEPPMIAAVYDNTGYMYGAGPEWATTPSPAFPPQQYLAEGNGHSYNPDYTPYQGFSGGFVNTLPIWT